DDIVIATDVDNASISYANAGGAVYIDMQAGTATDLDGSGFFIGNDTFSGISRVRGSSFDDEMHGSDGNDHLRGRGGDDWIFGGDGDDIIYGDERASRPDGGNDFL